VDERRLRPASYSDPLRKTQRYHSRWSEKKKLVWWDEHEKQWTGLDVPDFYRDRPPDYKPPEGAVGDAALAGDQPFILHPDGVAWLFVSVGLKDGPLPTHYEPLESPVPNPLYKGTNTNPAAIKEERRDNPYAHSPGDPRFPYVLSTYRLTEVVASWWRYSSGI
jgi:formate dehydrogenase major subunit